MCVALPDFAAATSRPSLELPMTGKSSMAEARVRRPCASLKTSLHSLTLVRFLQSFVLLARRCGSGVRRCQDKGQAGGLCISCQLAMNLEFGGAWKCVVVGEGDVGVCIF